MKTSKAKFPITVSENGVSAKIRKVSQIKGGRRYTIYVADFHILGKRKQVGRSKLADAKAVALEACRKTANGTQIALTLNTSQSESYLRASEALKAVGLPVDVACVEYAGAVAILAGRAGIAEACREWVKRHAVELPKISVIDAVEQLKQQAVTDRKSRRRQQQLSAPLDKLSGDLQIQVHQITPDIVSQWLAGLPLAERTRRNYRDVLVYFCRFCVRRGYITKGTDWLENVQQYRARKIGEIATYDPDEMRTLLNYAAKKHRRMVPFLAIGAFSGLRHSEISRLNWKQVDLEDGFIEVLPIDGTKSEERRRLVSIKANLKSWLTLYHKTDGKVCPFVNITKQILKLAAEAKIQWKHNALRHSCISYRVAECGDVARVSDESGNSPSVIRTNYLRRMKPAQAAEWFSIKPSVKRPAAIAVNQPLLKAA